MSIYDLDLIAMNKVLVILAVRIFIIKTQYKVDHEE